MRESVTEEPPPATQPIETKVEGTTVKILSITNNLYHIIYLIFKILFFRKYARTRNSSFLFATHQWSNSLLHL